MSFYMCASLGFRSQPLEWEEGAQRRVRFLGLSIEGMAQTSGVIQIYHYLPSDPAIELHRRNTNHMVFGLGLDPKPCVQQPKRKAAHPTSSRGHSRCWQVKSTERMTVSLANFHGRILFFRLDHGLKEHPPRQSLQEMTPQRRAASSPATSQSPACQNHPKPFMNASLLVASCY